MPLAYRIGTGASMDRLESLIEERLKPGADTKKIDSRIWDLFGEEWAIMDEIPPGAEGAYRVKYELE